MNEDIMEKLTLMYLEKTDFSEKTPEEVYRLYLKVKAEFKAARDKERQERKANN